MDNNVLFVFIDGIIEVFKYVSYNLLCDIFYN